MRSHPPSHTMSSSKLLESAAKYPFFAAREGVTKTLMWTPMAKADMLFDKASETEAALVVIASVTSSRCEFWIVSSGIFLTLTRFYAGSLGAYVPDFGPMEDAKYKITLGPPTDTALLDAYNTSIAVLGSLQRAVAKTDSSKNLIDVIDKVPHIRISLPVFDKRVILRPILP
jgi:hypothetical protein